MMVRAKTYETPSTFC